MRFELFMIPVAAVVGSAAHADNFLTVEQAQQQLFPGATFSPADFTMTTAQIAQLIELTQTTVFHSKVRAWKASTGGWFFLDQVMGRDDRVTYALALDEHGAVKGIEILVCLPGYCRVREPQWRDQFHGKRYGDGGDLMGQVSNISGESLTAEHVTEGTKRLLATYALFMAPLQK